MIIFRLLHYFLEAEFRELMFDSNWRTDRSRQKKCENVSKKIKMEKIRKEIRMSKEISREETGEDGGWWGTKKEHKWRWWLVRNEGGAWVSTGWEGVYYKDDDDDDDDDSDDDD